MSEETKNKQSWPMQKVRSTFIEFFTKQHDHVFWPSSPCVPVDDPTLLFTNAGMNQFKQIFLGTCDPNLRMSRLSRAVNSQKCIRAGGKHNDLDDVGKDVYHHTFFEMLGNWSFGNYFKKEAIDMAWTCLTVAYQLPPERLYATYFGGDEQTPADEEAKEMWLKYLPPERVLAFDAKDNFWEMGATGPCGPCTEIHYDRIGNRDASKFVNADLPDVIEIWNVVFIQYNRENDRSLRSLPAQHIDTGMGFERLTSILQGVDSNYDTDIFEPIFESIRKLADESIPKYSGKIGKDDKDFIDMAYRVVADHIRTLSFAIADGAVPSNDGRGYVLRRILRRAVRYGRQTLKMPLGFFAQLVPTVVNVMGGFYPELLEKRDYIKDIIRDEEESFSKTLDRGLMKFQELAKDVVNNVFSGEDAHFLYTTMGFPIDLTQLMAEELGMTVDLEGFEAKMKHEQELSALAHLEKMAGGSGKDMRMVAEQTAYLTQKNVPATNDDAKYIWDTPLENCIVQALFLGRNETVDKIGFVDAISTTSGMIGVVLDKTSFYAEAGGQIYDIGTVKTSTGAEIVIENVQCYGQFVLHIGRVTQGDVKLGDQVTCHVDYKRRLPIASNHTMTHVLNYALRKILLNESDSQQQVDQKGSLVDEQKLRFDFSWNTALTKDQLRQVEDLCRSWIQNQVPVRDYVAPLTDAQQISSLRAVFGEKYPDPVRVVSVSNATIPAMLSNPQDAQWQDYSVEFCGGTHLTNTKQAEAFCLLSEEGIAKGIRRIVAVTMDDAKKAAAEADEFAETLKEASDTNPAELEAQIKVLTRQVDGMTISTVRKTAFREELSKFTKKVLAWKKQKAAGLTDEIVSGIMEAATPDSPAVVYRRDFGIDGKLAKAVTQAFQKKVKDKSLMLISADEDDRFLIVASSPTVDCKAWVLAAVEGTEAKGGGKKDMAQYTVPGLEHVESVMEKAKAYV